MNNYFNFNDLKDQLRVNIKREKEKKKVHDRMELWIKHMEGDLFKDWKYFEEEQL